MRTRSRRGNVIMVLMTFTALLGFTAISVDIGIVMVARAQLQVAADAAVLAATGHLDGTEEGLTAAAEAAAMLASEHSMLGSALSVDASQIELGHYDEDTGAFIETNDPLEVDAIQIQLTPHEIRTPFAASLFEAQPISIATASMARRPSGAGPAKSSTCFLPIAVPDCHVTGLAEGVNPPPLRLYLGERPVFTPAEQRTADLLRATLDSFEVQHGADYVAAMEELLAPFLWPGGIPPSDIAWSRPLEGSNTAWLQAQIADRCAGGVIKVDEVVYVDETSQPDVLTDIVSVLNDRSLLSPDPWLDGISSPGRDGVTGNLPWNSSIEDRSLGNTLQGPVALVAADNCEEPTFDGPLTVTGIAWGAIYDARTTGDAPNLWVQLDLTNEYEIWGSIDDEALGNVLGRGMARYTRSP